MQEFFDAQMNNLRHAIKIPHIQQLTQAIHQAYTAARASVPPDGPPLLFGKLLLICHKSLLSAASLIVSSLPDDSVGITRRALEAAKVALAVKIDERNANAWLSFEERHSRWLARQDGRRPAHFKVSFEGVRGDPDIDFVDRYLGILSDAFVHFTPEYYSILDWEVLPGAGDQFTVRLNYFHRSNREIERQLLQLVVVHGRILQIFDRCYDHILSRDESFRTNLAEVWRVAKEFRAQYTAKYNQAS